MRWILPLLFIAGSCFGATTVTKTVKPSGGDYTTLSAWEAGRQADIVSADTIEKASIEGDWSSASDTTATTIIGWTTDATRYIEINVAAEARHAGVYTDTEYELAISGATAAITVSENYVRIYGVQAKNTATGGAVGFRVSTVDAGGSDIRFGYCIAKGVLSGGASGAIGFNINDSDATVIVYNCLSFDYIDGTSSSRGFNSSASTKLTLYNCTAHNNYLNYNRSAGTMVSTNCISQDAGSDGFAGTITGDYNVSDIASDSPGANSQNDAVNDVAFVDEANDDFHLASGDTEALNLGTDVSSSAGFSDDIDGQTRSGTWDIGFDERVSTTSSPLVGGLTTLLR